MIRGAALLALLVCARVAAADDTGRDLADATFRSALGAGDIDALERAGAARPITRWSDDAWLEAARLAARANDYARALRDLEQAIAVSTDDLLVRRARAELARLTGLAGSAGQWTAVAAAHERLVPALRAGGDPRATLRELEQLVRANPRYPRRSAVMLAIASAWEREGEGATAVAWLREARGAAGSESIHSLERLHAHAELIRTLIRTHELDGAEVELAALEPAAGQRSLVVELRAKLERAEWRRSVRWAMWGVLAVLTGFAVVMLRRAAGSWRAAGRRLLRPPSETIYLIPIAVVLVVVAYTGNPLVARAVRRIVVAGIAASWISGAILGAARITLRRALLHGAVAMLAVVAITYIAVDDGRLIDFVIETWRAGHERG